MNQDDRMTSKCQKHHTANQKINQKQQIQTGYIQNVPLRYSITLMMPHWESV